MEVIVIGLLVAAIAIAGLLVYWKRRSTIKDSPSDGSIQTGQDGGKMSKKNAKLESVDANDKGFSVQLFVHLKSFSGSLNSLEDIVGKDFDASFAKITFDNIEQIICFYGDDNDKNRFIHDRKEWGGTLYKAKAQELLNVIKSYGVTPVKKDEVVWDKALLAQYMRLTPVEEGQMCEIVAPYWVFSGEVFEKGIVKPKINR